MSLSELINEKNIVIPLQSRDRDSAIREMVEHLGAASYVQNTEVVIKAILDREKMGSTGLEKGIAVPHTRTEEVAELCVALGISHEGIPTNAMDGKDSQFFFMILANPEHSSRHIKILSEIARISKNEDMLNSLYSAQSIEDVMSLFSQ